MIIELPISNLLVNNETVLKPQDANKLNLDRIHKIDFKGNIHFKKNKKTNTNMILVKKNSFLISGINVTKGASSFYNGDKDVVATIHYSSYKVNEKLIFIPYFKQYLKSSKFLDLLSESKKGGIKTEIKPKQLLKVKIKIPDTVKEQKIRYEKINNLLNKYKKLKELVSQQKEIMPSIVGNIYNELYDEAVKKGKLIKLKDLILDKPRNGYSPKAVKHETKIKSLILSATTRGFFDESKFKFIDENIDKDSHLWLEENDILIQRGNTREYVGVSAVVKSKVKGFIYPDLMMKIKCKNEILPEYLHCMLMSEKIRNYFRSKAKGTSGSMPKINQPVVQNAEIPFVKNINFQKEIIDKSIIKIKKFFKLIDIIENLEISNEFENLIINKFLIN